MIPFRTPLAEKAEWQEITRHTGAILVPSHRIGPATYSGRSVPRGFVHRDLKLENIFFQGMLNSRQWQESVIKIGDFGSVLRSDGPLDCSIGGSTPFYIPPEVWRYRKATCGPWHQNVNAVHCYPDITNDLRFKFGWSAVEEAVGAFKMLSPGTFARRRPWPRVEPDAKRTHVFGVLERKHSKGGSQ